MNEECYVYMSARLRSLSLCRVTFASPAQEMFFFDRVFQSWPLSRLTIEGDVLRHMPMPMDLVPGPNLTHI